MIGELDPEPLAVAETVAADRHAELIRPLMGPEPALRAAGGFQRANFALAAAAAEAFLGRPLDRRAVEAAAAETVVPGRLEVVAERPLTVFDGAHNPSSGSAGRAWR